VPTPYPMRGAILHGWRDQTGDGLVELARETVRAT
jgi:hypothetical protein